MNLTIHLYKECPDGAVEPIQPPLTRNLPEEQLVRELLGEVAASHGAPLHSATITTPSGPERWYRLNGRWKRADVYGERIKASEDLR
jgi:hypothetical protein